MPGGFLSAKRDSLRFCSQAFAHSRACRNGKSYCLRGRFSRATIPFFDQAVSCQPRDSRSRECVWNLRSAVFNRSRAMAGMRPALQLTRGPLERSWVSSASFSEGRFTCAGTGEHTLIPALGNHLAQATRTNNLSGCGRPLPLLPHRLSRPGRFVDLRAPQPGKSCALTPRAKAP
jgi:hypothetical protein